MSRWAFVYAPRGCTDIGLFVHVRARACTDSDTDTHVHGHLPVPRRVERNNISVFIYQRHSSDWIRKFAFVVSVCYGPACLLELPP